MDTTVVAPVVTTNRHRDLESELMCFAMPLISIGDHGNEQNRVARPSADSSRAYRQEDRVPPPRHQD